MEEKMQSGVQICNTDVVVELKVYFVSTMGIDPLKVHLKDKISEIKERVCDEVAKQIGKTYACEPELFTMVLFPDSHVLDNDSDKTLGQVLFDVGIINDEDDCEGSELFGISWDTCNSVDDLLLDDKSQSGEQDVELIFNSPGYVKLFSNRVFVVHLFPTWTDHRKSSHSSEKEEDCLEEDCNYSEEEIVIYPEDAFSVKKPDDDILPADSGNCRVFDELVATRNTDHGEKKRYIPYKGLTYPLELVTNLSTSASLVLLDFDVIEEFKSHLDNTSDILLLQVSWDKFSYLFLRKLRQDLGPHVPIVAVTDLDVRHLDLLAFLDTPPCDLPKLYGWSLSQDCVHLGDCTEYVDIKWLGIRPSDSDDASDYHSCFAKASRKLPDDFKEVYDFLLAHPHFSRKSNWVQELQVIPDRELHRSLPYLWQGLHWYASSLVWENYLPTKIANKDWI